MTISAENDVSQPGRSRRSVISVWPSLRVYFSCFCYGDGGGGSSSSGSSSIGDYCGEVAVVASRSTTVGGHLGAKCEYRVRAVLKLLSPWSSICLPVDPPHRAAPPDSPTERPAYLPAFRAACLLALTTATVLHLPTEEPRPLIFRHRRTVTR